MLLGNRGRENVRQQIQKHWFLGSLLIALCVGYLLRTQVTQFAETTEIRSFIVASVLFLMGLAFSARSLLRSIFTPTAALIAIALNMLAVPTIAYLLSGLLPSTLAGGLIVTASVPCTLASASLWTRRAGGDDSVSMLVTVATNFACFFVAPVTLLLLMGQNVEIDFWNQVEKLAILVVAPMTIAQSLRLSLSVRHMVDRSREMIAVLSQIGILSMVVMGTAASTSAATSAGDVSSFSYITMILAAGLTHALVLGGGVALARMCSLPRSQQVAVGISASQKTLMVGLQIAIDFKVSVMPMIAYHIFQLVFDTVFADRWARTKGDENA